MKLSPLTSPFGRPHLHFALLPSTNAYLRTLASTQAPHGTLVTAEHQTAGRGRHGRSWFAPPGRALLMSILLRDFDSLLSLRAGAAIAQTIGQNAQVKWPNDIWLDRRKVAGVLVERDENWAILGVGINVAVRPHEFPASLRNTAATLNAHPSAIEPLLHKLLAVLDQYLVLPSCEIIDALRSRDALLGRRLSSPLGAGVGIGIDMAGQLKLRLDTGKVVALGAGEIAIEPD